MINIDYFRAIQNALGYHTEQDVSLAEIQRNIRSEMETSLHYERGVLRNGEKQNFVITTSEQPTECDILALPGEELHDGDYIEWNGNVWIVISTYIANKVQIRGKILLCNLLLRFQHGTSEIHERWAAFDSGVYSTTIGGQKPLFYPNVQYKVYMQYDEDTKYLHVDKRFAADKVYDQFGEEVLSVFRFTATNDISIKNGDAHLLLMKAISDEFNPSSDSLEHMICDYISDDKPKDEEVWY